MMDTQEKRSAGSIALFIALMATTLALGGALAHVNELNAKMSLSRDDYFIVQQIYRGWNQQAWVLGVEMIAIPALITIHRQYSSVVRPAVLALICLIASQAIVWIWTFPANAATDQWMTQPANWETLRREWEYSHLAGAGFQLVTMAALIVACLRQDCHQVISDHHGPAA